MVSDRLGQNLLIRALRLGLCMGYMLHLMGTYGVSSILRADMSGSFERNTGVIRAVLVFSVFAGLAFVSVKITAPGNFLAVFLTFGFGKYRLFGSRCAGGLRGICGNLNGVIEYLLIYG